jgi:signal transduction histidine kinase
MREYEMQESKPSENNLLRKIHHKRTDKPVSQPKEEEYFRLDDIPVACCSVAPNLTIVDCNIRFAHLLGEVRDRLIRASFLNFVDRSSLPIFEKILTLRSRKENFIMPSIIPSQTIWLRNDNSRSSFPCTLYLKQARNDNENNNNYLIVVIDETLNRRAIDLLEEDRNQLKKKEKLQDEFLAIASHELRTPIQPILGFAFLAKQGLITEEKAWDGVLGEARRLQQLANDILDVSRIESGTLVYNMSKEKINLLLAPIVESAKSELQKKNVSISLIYDESMEELEIEADRHRITQVISNILGNAIKFTENGNIRVESKASLEENRLEIQIRDTGKGIDETILPRLFEKFLSKGHDNIENKQGTGLGLYISKNIVKAHGGDITAFNNADGGATFVIVLPISQKKGIST